MTQLSESSAVIKAKHDVMAANRILARENVVDGYGHVSMRHPEHPDRFLLSRSRSPELVEVGDIMEFTPRRQGRGRRLATGRTSSASSTARSTRPARTSIRSFTRTPRTSSRTRSAKRLWSRSGTSRARWATAARCGTSASASATRTCWWPTSAQGRDLAKTLGKNNVVLMRGHGFACGRRPIYEAVRSRSTCRSTRASSRPRPCSARASPGQPRRGREGRPVPSRRRRPSCAVGSTGSTAPESRPKR